MGSKVTWRLESNQPPQCGFSSKTKAGKPSGDQPCPSQHSPPAARSAALLTATAAAASPTLRLARAQALAGHPAAPAPFCTIKELGRNDRDGKVDRGCCNAAGLPATSAGQHAPGATDSPADGAPGNLQRAGVGKAQELGQLNCLQTRKSSRRCVHNALYFTASAAAWIGVKYCSA